MSNVINRFQQEGNLDTEIEEIRRLMERILDMKYYWEKKKISNMIQLTLQVYINKVSGMVQRNNESISKCGCLATT